MESFFVLLSIGVYYESICKINQQSQSNPTDYHRFDHWYFDCTLRARIGKMNLLY